jgi:hypothetical protein
MHSHVSLAQVFKDERLSLWLRPLQILVTSNMSGLIEVVGSAVSLHQTKRKSGDSLLAYFEQEFGPQTCERFMDAQVGQPFMRAIPGLEGVYHAILPCCFVSPAMLCSKSL